MKVGRSSNQLGWKQRRGRRAVGSPRAPTFCPLGSWADKGSRRVGGTGWNGKGQEALWASEKEGGTKTYHPVGHRGGPVTSATVPPWRRNPSFSSHFIQHPVHSAFIQENQCELDILPLTETLELLQWERPHLHKLRALEHPRRLESQLRVETHLGSYPASSTHSLRSLGKLTFFSLSFVT